MLEDFFIDSGLLNLRIALFGLVAVVGACTAASNDPSRVVEARELWTATRPETYEMTFQVECGICYWRTGHTTVRVGPGGEPLGEATSPED